MSRRGRLNMLMRGIATVSALGAAFVVSPVFAQDIKAPSDPLEKAAFNVLEKHCARCHQEGRLTGRDRPAKNFGNVLQLEELADDPSKILAGNPFGSKLFKQIVDKEMPYDVIYEGASYPDIASEEIRSLETWIASLSRGGRKIAVVAAPASDAPQPQVAVPAEPQAEQAQQPQEQPQQPPQQQAAIPAEAPQAAPAPIARPGRPGPRPIVAPAAPEPAPVAVAADCDAHKFVTPKDMIGMMAADLDTLPKQRQKGTRYLTLTHLTNVCAKEKALEAYRQGAIKLVNSLSRSPDVVRLETIDPDGSILRINIDDLGWDAADWDALVAAYPYAVQPETQLTSVLQGATATKLAHVRADWFAFTASRPGMYEKLLKLPKTFQALAKEQGVDVDANIKKFLALRSGFQKSGVSQNNRLIERHPSRSGYFWTSYDFAGNKQRQSLFEHPNGPNVPNGFDHDGGETIYSLPNGFQAYYLSTAKGDALDKGPTNIVRDLTRKDLTVTNGISCMGCHDQGMRKAKDEVRDVVVKSRTHTKQVREQVEAMHVPPEKMDQIIASDGKRFIEAMARAGLNPTLKLNGVEMTNALSDRYEADVDIELAAAEFGMKRDEFLAAAGNADKKFKTILRRLEQGTVPRDQMESTYLEIAADITDMEPVKVAVAKGKEVKPQKVAPKGDLTLTSDRDQYRQGDSPILSVIAARDCFLTLTNVDDKGVGTVIFPNKFQQNNLIKANLQVDLPGTNAFKFLLKDKGVETVIGVCADGKKEVDGIKHDFATRQFTTVQNYSRSVAQARAIAVVPDAKPVAPAPGKPAPVAAAPGKPAPVVAAQAQVRTAIKFEVQ